MLLQLAYLATTNAFALLRLLPPTERERDAEILALRHQITVLQRQLHGERPKFTTPDRALLAALLHPLPRTALKRLRLLVHPDTVLRWHRDLATHRHTRASRASRPGRPRTVRPIRALVLRLARENPSCGYRRIHGELTLLGIAVAASTVWEILKSAGVDPAPQRSTTTWADFLRGQAEAIMACDFIETVTPTGQRQYILAAIEHTTRRIRILGTTAHPTGEWTAQAIRNLVMDLEDTGATMKYFLRDWGHRPAARLGEDAKFTEAFDTVPADAGIQVVLSGIRMPRMNAIMERWAGTCRSELLDRTLIRNQRHLLRALREFETHYNVHRTHRSLSSAAPLRALPAPITVPDELESLRIRRRDRLGGTLHEYHRDTA